MATTTNYGWTTPDNTALVKDGALAIRTLGSAIDTSLNTALGTRKAGMVLLNTTSFSGVASQSFTSVLDNTKYSSYRLVVNCLMVTGGSELYFRFRNGASDRATNDYYGNGFFTDSDNTSGTQFPLNPSTVAILGKSNSTANTISVADFSAGGTGQYPVIVGQFFNFTDYRANYFGYGRNVAAEANDGFTLSTSAGNITGTASVYGYQK